MKLTIVSFRFSHHGRYSGYNRLVDYLPSHILINGQAIVEILEWLDKRNIFIKKIGYKIFGGKHYWLEYVIPFKTRNDNKTIVHYLYTENQYKNFWKFKGQRKIICTFHQPREYYKKLIKRKKEVEKYKHLDAAIIVSESIKSIIEELIGHKNVFYVPHGVDTNFFKPSNIKKKLQIITVGNWMRDFELLNRVANEVFKKNNRIVFKVISLDKNRSFFNNSPNIKFESNISNKDLLKEYQTSLFTFLPLKDCTANNAILESMACGLPLVVTNIGGVKNYTNKKVAIYIDPEENVSEISDIILRLVKDEKKIESMSIASRMHSLKYDWEKIAKKTEKIYKSII